jgi:hypothetical protein
MLNSMSYQEHLEEMLARDPEFKAAWERQNDFNDKLVAFLKENSDLPHDDLTMLQICDKIETAIDEVTGFCPYHLNHDYVITVRRLRPEEGGGYIAQIPQLGGGVFNGCGETVGQAISCLEQLWAWIGCNGREPLGQDDGSYTFPEPKDEDYIQFLAEVPGKLSIDEINAKFAEYLAEAKQKLTERGEIVEE